LCQLFLRKEKKQHKKDLKSDNDPSAGSPTEQLYSTKTILLVFRKELSGDAISCVAFLSSLRTAFACGFDCLLDVTITPLPLQSVSLPRLTNKFLLGPLEAWWRIIHC
jgi:hypothetical protein